MMAMVSVNKAVPFWFILIFAGIVWGGQYVVRDLWEPDEARYTYVAREMDQTGSWLVPMRSGDEYTHKPPLMFWLIKAGTVLTGGEYNGVSGRFPTFLGVLLSLWAITRICLFWFEAQTAPQIAWRTFFILSTSSLFWLKAGTGQIDMLLLGLELMALYFLFKNDEIPALWRPAMAFFLMGLAILAKGPVGLIVPVGIYITANMASGQARNFKKTFWLWGVPLALLPPAAWLLGAKASGASPEFFNELLFAQNFGRAIGEFGGHAKPFYYYLQYLFVDFMPWIFFVPASIWVLKNDGANRKYLKLLAGWMGFVIVFFSLSASKRNLYILSVYPAASIMVAAAWPRLKEMTKKWINGSAYTVMGVVLVSAIAGIFGIAAPLMVDLPFNSLALVPMTLVLGVGAFLLFRQYRSAGLDNRWFNRLVMVLLLAEFCISIILFPALNPMKTPRLLAAEAQSVLPKSQELLLYQMNGEILAFYSNRPGRRMDGMDALALEMKRQGKGIVVFSQKSRKDIESRFSSFGSIQAFRMGGKNLCFLKYDFDHH